MAGFHARVTVLFDEGDLVALTGQMTFPQILVGKRSIGGFRELIEADREGRLDALLAA